LLMQLLKINVVNSLSAFVRRRVYVFYFFYKMQDNYFLLEKISNICIGIDFSALMEESSDEKGGSIVSWISPWVQNRPCQWMITYCRSMYYPLYHLKWEANEILEDLYLGSLDTAFCKDEMAQRGITHIVCAIYDLKDLYPDDFTYMRVSIIDESKANINKYFYEVHKFISRAIRSGGKVLVHCQAGRSRSSTLVAAYLCIEKKMEVTAAIRFIKQKRPMIDPNVGFLAQLANTFELEKSLCIDDDLNIAKCIAARNDL
jgi:protein-tyrosine phosphatase